MVGREQKASRGESRLSPEDHEAETPHDRTRRNASRGRKCARESGYANGESGPPTKSLRPRRQQWKSCCRRKGKRPPDADQGGEVMRLRAEVARLTEENARLKLARSKAGRKPIGDRAMTPAERMARMRAKARH